MSEIEIVMLLHIFFSQYCNISSSKIISLLLRFYCICVSLALLYFMIAYLNYLFRYDTKGVAFNMCITVEFVVRSFMSQMNSQTFMFDYTRSLLACDSFMGYKKQGLRLKSVFIVLMLIICLGVISFCIDLFVSQFWAHMFFLDTYYVFYLMSHQFVMMSLDMPICSVLIVVGMLRNRLILLRKTLKNSISVCGEGSAERSKLRVVRKCSLNYRNLLDAFGIIYGQLQLTIFLTILFCAPRLTMFGYCILKQIIFDDFQKFMSRVYFVDYGRLLLRIAAPCVLCELCCNEVELLKISLIKQIVRSSDAELRAELQRALDYVMRRPFNFTLLRAVRVDIQLPLAICAFCVTYVILLIEFTHFVL